MTRRRRKKKRRTSPKTNQPISYTDSTVGISESPVVTEAELVKEAENLHFQASTEATELDIDQIEAVKNAGALDLDASVKKADEARQLFELQRIRLKSAEEDFEQKKNEYESKLQALLTRQTELGNQQDDITKEQRVIEDSKRKLELEGRELDTREINIEAREVDAKAGFLALKKEILNEIGESVTTARELLTSNMHKLSQQQEQLLEQYQNDLDIKRSNYLDILEEKRRLHEEEWTGELESLKKQRSDVMEKRQEWAIAQNQLEQNRQQLDIDREILTSDRNEFKRHVSQLAALEVDKLNRELRLSEDQLEIAQTEEGRLRKLLKRYEDLAKRLGERSPDELISELEQLKKDRDELAQQLIARPSIATLKLLSDLEREKDTWGADRFRLESKNHELQRSLASRQIAVVQLETLRDEKQAYEASNRLLHKSLEELRADVNQRINESGSDSPFPACRAMDEDQNLQEKVEVLTLRSLKKFVSELQHRIGYDPITKTKLYYSIKDIRSFVAGLATGYLTVIQGVSGTGKTSLPLAFARAVGGGSQVVEVQAGWRDRQDLLGYYNSFERKYYESVFLRALYKAQSPAYKNRIFIVVLDEMNLSYPEQYFADLLSVLERPNHKDWEINLMTAPSPEDQHIPAFLMDKGRTIQIPQNIRFVGTANQDETTKDLADKTYDRAHIMELPVLRPEFDLRTTHEQIKPKSYSSMATAFNAAIEKYADEACHSYQFLESELRDDLRTRFGIGWGLRLRRQVDSYVPVVIASGGSIGEATDYVLARKILRKLRNRYDIREPDLLDFRQLLESKWRTLDDNAYPEPVKSQEVIDSERIRLGYRKDT